jgi:hypothetical protein
LAVRGWHYLAFITTSNRQPAGVASGDPLAQAWK